MNAEHDPYRNLAKRLDTIPNGYPATDDGSELRILEYLFKPEEADLASQLRLTLESAEQISLRLGLDYLQTRQMLKSLARRGLIRGGKVEGGIGYGLIPFAVGIYENQNSTFTEEFARLFEDYFQKGFTKAVAMQPAVHRVIPVGESIKNDMQVAPFESAVGIIENAQSWGVLDCMCRRQTAFIGRPCNHPVDVCMVLSQKPDAFAGSEEVKALTKEESYAVLRKADQAGLVHSVSNNQDGIWYICNCCTCSCGILRSMAEMGIANVVASSAFVNTVDESLCNTCGLCIEYCQFNALSLAETAVVNRMRCVGCGVCVSACPDHALVLVRRPEDEIKPVPVSIVDWGIQRAQERGVDISQIL